MTRIDPPVVLLGGYFNQVPTLKSPFTVFCFDHCHECESVFLNPDQPRQNQIDAYKRSTHYVKKMEDQAEWSGYVKRYEMMKRYLPAKTETFIDAACGLGQLAILARDDKSMKWSRLAALELSSAYVKHLNDNGIEAYEFDIDNDSISNNFEANSIDFIAFFEAFEHVAWPVRALEKLISVLRPGGRIFFSAQRYGSDVNLAIRPGEPIYIGEKFIDEMDDMLGCDTIDVVRNGSRFFIVLEKRATASAKAHKLAANEIALSRPFRHELGNCWIAELDQHHTGMEAALLQISDNNATTTRSGLRLREMHSTESLELGPAHSIHAQIRDSGKGQFSHWNGQLYFSTSDNSDPNTNNRTYILTFPEVL